MEAQHLCNRSQTSVQTFEWTQKEVKEKRMNMSIHPTSNDVLLGRGGNNYAHEGNERLRNFALCRVNEYGAADKTGKGIISRQVLQQVKETGGRFLKKNYKADVWVEVSNETAREKVCQVLRDHVSAIRDNCSTLGSDRSSSSEDTKASGCIKTEEEEEEDSGDDEICHMRGGGESEAQSGLPQVKQEAGGFFSSDDVMERDDLPLQYLITSSIASPTLRERFESLRDSFEVGADYTFASSSGDFDLFEGELLRSSAYDEIFIASSEKNVMQL